MTLDFAPFGVSTVGLQSTTQAKMCRSLDIRTPTALPLISAKLDVERFGLSLSSFMLIITELRDLMHLGHWHIMVSKTRTEDQRVNPFGLAELNKNL